MKIDFDSIANIHLDPGYALLSVQNCFTAMEIFNILDIEETERLNDVQFLFFMKNVTNLNSYDIEIVFNLLDVDNSGEIEFDEFYLMFCIIIANKDAYEKEFIYRHSHSIFKLIDDDGSGEISIKEFRNMGFLFNFDRSAIKSIFKEFDYSGDRNLDFAEFRLFTMACIDEARAQAVREKVKAFEDYHKRLLNGLEPILRRFVRTEQLPFPRLIETTVNKIKLPHARAKRYWDIPHLSKTIFLRFEERRQQVREFVEYKFGKPRCLFAICRMCCCDFCCLSAPEDKIKCSCSCKNKMKCKCKCSKCFKRWFRRLFGCCFCCCHCCKHYKSQKQYQQHYLRYGIPEGGRDSREQKQLIGKNMSPTVAIDMTAVNNSNKQEIANTSSIVDANITEQSSVTDEMSSIQTDESAITNNKRCIIT